MGAGAAVLQAAPHPIAAVAVVLTKRTAVDRVAVAVRPRAEEVVILKMAAVPDAGAENMRMMTWTFSPIWIPRFGRRPNQSSLQDKSLALNARQDTLPGILFYERQRKATRWRLGRLPGPPLRPAPLDQGP